MKDRKTLGIVLLFLVFLLAVSLWRISLLDGWMLPRFKNSGEAIAPVSALALLWCPASYLFSYLVLFVRDVFRKGREEDFRPYRARNAFMMAGSGLALSAMQLYIIVRSFGGPAPIESVMLVRFLLIFMGLVIVVTSNQVPKMPWLRSRIRLLDLDPLNGVKLLRFSGYAGVAGGLSFIVVALLTPEKQIGPAAMALNIFYLLVVLSFFIWAQFKRRQGAA